MGAGCKKATTRMELVLFKNVCVGAVVHAGAIDLVVVTIVAVVKKQQDN